MHDSLYTPQIEKIIYQFKARLPKDFPLITVEREIYGSDVPDTIIIVVEMKHFAWRTVEQRLAIVLELEAMKTAIEGTGIGCLIEKLATR